MAQGLLRAGGFQEASQCGECLVPTAHPPDCPSPTCRQLSWPRAAATGTMRDLWALVLVGLINTCNGMEMPAEEGKGHREWGHRVCTPRMCPSLLTCPWAFNEKMRAMLEP